MNKIYNRLLQILYDFLKQGRSPRELAIAIALGVIIGMFPLQGTTTLMCTLISLLFRLNLLIIQLANYLSIPLMLVMLVPFYSLGHRLFSTQAFTLNPEEVFLLFHHDFLGTLTRLSWSVSYALLAWLILAPFIGGLVYFISLRIIKRLKFRTYE